MYKVVSSLLVSSLLMSAVVPISNVQAEENENKISIQKKDNIENNLSSIKFEPIVDNADFTTINVIYPDGKTSLSEYNKKTGEVLFDGVLVATIKEEKSSDTVEPLVFENQPNFSIESVQQYTIGTRYGSSYINQYSRDFSFSVASTASVVGIAAGLAALYIEQKPNQQAAGLISAAGQLIALTTSSYTYTVRYTHYKDGQYSGRYMDKLSIYKGAISSLNLKMQILHYYGTVY